MKFFNELLVCMGIAATAMAFFLIWCVFVIPHKNRRRIEKEEGGGYEDLPPTIPETRHETRAPLAAVHTKLRRAGAYLPVPWISSCISAIDSGRACPPDVALAALVETAEDLKDTRWETDEMAGVFAEAAGELSRML